MRIIFLLFSALTSSLVSSQSLPTPLYESTFNGSDWNSAAGFSVTATNIMRDNDQFAMANSSVYLYTGHGDLQLEGTNAALKEQGTISFFANYSNPGATPNVVTSINGAYPILYLNNGTSTYGEGLMFGISTGGKLILKSYISNTSGYSNQSTEDLNPNQWHHFAISYKFGLNGYITVYRNGKQIIHQEVHHQLTNNTYPFQFLGHTIPGSTYKPSLNSYLDEIRAYSTSFTEAQVKELYTSYFTIGKGSVTAKYNFNDGNFNDYYGNVQ